MSAPAIISAEWYQTNNLYDPQVMNYVPISVHPQLTFGGLCAGTSPISFSTPTSDCEVGLGVGGNVDGIMRVKISSDPQPIEYNTVVLEIYRNAEPIPSTDYVPLNLGLQPNNVNYVWVGASKPTFQYNSTKGRVEFIQLQEDNILKL